MEYDSVLHSREKLIQLMDANGVSLLDID